jgi:hypothetical protein
MVTIVHRCETLPFSRFIKKGFAKFVFTRDQCYDFTNIFADKKLSFYKKKNIFDSKYVHSSINAVYLALLLFRRRTNFLPKMVNFAEKQ